MFLMSDHAQEVKNDYPIMSNTAVSPGFKDSVFGQEISKALDEIESLRITVGMYQSDRGF